MSARGQTVEFTERLVIEQCCNCQIWFAMPKDMQDRRKKDHKWFWCPAGHEQHYTAKSEEEKQRERAEQAERLAEQRLTARKQLQDQLAASESANQSLTRSNTALKGVVTKAKQRTANGVCPCCHRHFSQLQNHIAKKHPHYAEEA